MADDLKTRGDAAFQAGKFTEASILYTDAIALSSKNYLLYSNRSASYASLSKFSEALEDAEKTVNLDPKWPKGYSRLDVAYVGLGNYSDAVYSYARGLEMDSSSSMLKDGLTSIAISEVIKVSENLKDEDNLEDREKALLLINVLIEKEKVSIHDNDTLWYWKIILLSEKGLRDDSFLAALDLVNVYDEYGHVLNITQTMGYGYAKLNDYVNACEWYTRASQVAKKDGDKQEFEYYHKLAMEENDKRLEED